MAERGGRQALHWLGHRAGGESYDNAEYQDQVESAALYDQLEHEIVPAFYERGADLLPRRWIAGMKSSVATLCATFNMQRVVKSYAADCYVVAHERYRNLTRGGSGRSPGRWRHGADASSRNGRRCEWSRLTDCRCCVAVGATGDTGARAAGRHSTGEVTVEIYVGRLNAHSEISGGVALPSNPSAKSTMACRRSRYRGAMPR